MQPNQLQALDTAAKAIVHARRASAGWDAFMIQCFLEALKTGPHAHMPAPQGWHDYPTRVRHVSMSVVEMTDDLGAADRLHEAKGMVWQVLQLASQDANPALRVPAQAAISAYAAEYASHWADYWTEYLGLSETDPDAVPDADVLVAELTADAAKAVQQ